MSKISSEERKALIHNALGFIMAFSALSLIPLSVVHFLANLYVVDTFVLPVAMVAFFISVVGMGHMEAKPARP